MTVIQKVNSIGGIGELIQYISENINDNVELLIRTDKAKIKFINLVGQEFYNNLIILHNADIEAH